MEIEEDIELKFIIDKEIFIGKDVFIIDDNVIKYLGNMYEDLKEGFIQCPRISSIDEYYIIHQLHLLMLLLIFLHI